LPDGTAVASGEGGGVRVGGAGGYQHGFTHHMFLPVGPEAFDEPPPPTAPALVEAVAPEPPAPTPDAVNVAENELPPPPPDAPPPGDGPEVPV
jgi:hypothetical protein